jgi:SAM-dependent methyltransferase
MKETGKMAEVRRNRGDFQSFLHGKGIDIGCGDDILKVDDGTVQPWDVGDGDAQLMKGIPDGEFDFVYSSHCLEHMRDVRESLVNWTRILKPGGFLYVVIPDYMLYEKLTWPSRFNDDHKQSFSVLIPRRAVARPNHWHVEQDLKPLMQEVGLEVVRFTFEDYGYNYNSGLFDQTRLPTVVAQLCFVAKKR